MRKRWLFIVVLIMMLIVSGCDVFWEKEKTPGVTAKEEVVYDQSTPVPTCEDVPFGQYPQCEVTSNPNVSMDCFTWFYDCDEDGCGQIGEGQPVGFVPVTCSESYSPTPNCGVGEGFDATCAPAPTCAPGQLCYENIPVIAVPILGWGIIGCNQTPTPNGSEPYNPNSPNNLNAYTPTITCDPNDPDNPNGSATATLSPTMTITPEITATLTPTPYIFATHCGPCVPTEVPNFDYINLWSEFQVVLDIKVKKYVHFPVTVYHRVNEYEFIAIWGDAEDYSQVVWVQLQKDGPQRTDGIYPGIRLMVYGQVNVMQACTDDVSDSTICFPAVAGASIVER